MKCNMLTSAKPSVFEAISTEVAESTVPSIN